MNSMLLNIIIQTIPKTPANEYEESKLIIKSRKAWKKDRKNYSVLAISAAIAFVLTDKLSIPFIGNLLFTFGVCGFLAGIFFGFRAHVIYKHYFDIYKEEDIKKIIEE